MRTSTLVPVVLGSPFTPKRLPGLQLWLDAGVGLFSDAGITPAVPDATIQQWNDQSGLGQNVSQATAGSRPQFKANILGGRPVLRLDGTDDRLFGTIVSVAQPFTAIIVANVGASASGSKTPFGFTSASIYMNVNEQAGLFAGAAADSTAAIDGAFKILGGVFQGAASVLRVNGVPTVLNPGGNATGTGVNLGSNSTPLEFIAGDIAEAILCQGALPATWIARVERYLNRKYGMGLGL